MNKLFAVGVAAAVVMSPIATFAADTGTPTTSERAMAPDSGQTGASADKTMTGRSAATPSERAMDPAAGNAGASPSPKSERAMDPAKSVK